MKPIVSLIITLMLYAPICSGQRKIATREEYLKAVIGDPRSQIFVCGKYVCNDKQKLFAENNEQLFFILEKHRKWGWQQYHDSLYRYLISDTPFPLDEAEERELDNPSYPCKKRDLSIDDLIKKLEEDHMTPPPRPNQCCIMKELFDKYILMMHDDLSGGVMIMYLK